MTRVMPTEDDVAAAMTAAASETKIANDAACYAYFALLFHFRKLKPQAAAELVGTPGMTGSQAAAIQTSERWKDDAFDRVCEAVAITADDAPDDESESPTRISADDEPIPAAPPPGTHPESYVSSRTFNIRSGPGDSKNHLRAMLAEACANTAKMQIKR